jgi:hypothetical protein
MRGASVLENFVSMTSAPDYHGEPRVGGTRNLWGKRGKRIVL